MPQVHTTVSEDAETAVPESEAVGEEISLEGNRFYSIGVKPSALFDSSFSILGRRTDGPSARDEGQSEITTNSTASVCAIRFYASRCC